MTQKGIILSQSKGFAPIIILLVGLVVLGGLAIVVLPLLNLNPQEALKKAEEVRLVQDTNKQESKPKIAFIESTKSNPSLQWPDNLILYVSNIDRSDRRQILDLTELSEVKESAWPRLLCFLSDSKEVVMDTGSSSSDTTLVAVDINNHQKRNISNDGCKKTKLSKDQSIVIEYTYANELLEGLGEGEAYGEIPVKYINFVINNHDTGETKTIEYYKNKVNKPSYKEALGQKTIIAATSKYAYFMDTWNGYANQIDNRLEQLDLISGEFSSSTTLPTILEKLKQGMSLAYVTPTFKDSVEKNHLIYRSEKGEEIRYYDLILELGQEKEVKILPSSAISNWRYKDDIVGGGFDYEAFDMYISNSPIKQNINDCAYYNINRGEMVGFPPTDAPRCNEIILQ